MSLLSIEILKIFYCSFLLQILCDFRFDDLPAVQYGWDYSKWLFLWKIIMCEVFFTNFEPSYIGHIYLSKSCFFSLKLYGDWKKKNLALHKEQKKLSRLNERHYVLVYAGANMVEVQEIGILNKTCWRCRTKMQ